MQLINTERGFRRFGALLAALGLLISIITVTFVIGDLHRVRVIWDELRWWNLLWVVLLAAANHFVRYWRWNILLKRVTSRDIRMSTAFYLFSAGSLLIFTPARIGEVAKSIYIRDFFGIPIATSLPVLVLERIADFVVMALLASIGLLIIGDTTDFVLASVILGVTLGVLVLWRPMVDCMARCRLVRRWVDTRLGQILSLANASQRSLLVPGALAISLGLGICAWMTEVLIYFFVLSAIGVTVDIHLFLVALAVFPLASIGGSLSFLPGGLGATEGGLVALGILLGGLSAETAVLAALLSRAAILGMVVVAGIVSLLFLHRMPRPQHTGTY